MKYTISNNLIYIYFFSSICLLIASSLLIINSYYKIKNSNYKFIQSLGKSWSKGIITSIDIRDECYNKNINDIELIDFFWLGTHEGCDCTLLKNSKDSNPISHGYCSRAKGSSQRYCLDINKIPPIKFSKWGERKVCGVRKEDNYLELNIINRSNLLNYNFYNNNLFSKQISSIHKDNDFYFIQLGCSSGMKLCGIIDSLNNNLCVNINDKCPINYIKIVNKDFNINEELFELNKLNKEKYEYYKKEASLIEYNYIGIQNKIIIEDYPDIKYFIKKPIDDNRILIYSNENFFGNILSEFIVSEDLPCLNPENYNYPEENYILSKIKDNKGCTKINNQYFDTNSVRLDFDYKMHVYYLNEIDNNLKNLPQYKTNKNALISLYARSYLGLEDKCKYNFIKYIKDSKEFKTDNVIENYKDYIFIKDNFKTNTSIPSNNFINNLLVTNEKFKNIKHKIIICFILVALSVSVVIFYCLFYFLYYYLFDIKSKLKYDELKYSYKYNTNNLHNYYNTVRNNSNINIKDTNIHNIIDSLKELDNQNNYLSTKTKIKQSSVFCKIILNFAIITGIIHILYIFYNFYLIISIPFSIDYINLSNCLDKSSTTLVYKFLNNVKEAKFLIITSGILSLTWLLLSILYLIYLFSFNKNILTNNDILDNNLKFRNSLDNDNSKNIKNY